MNKGVIFNRKIKNRLFIQFLGSLVLVIIILGLFLHYYLSSFVGNMIDQRAEVKVKLAYETVSHWVDEDSIEIKAFANFLSYQRLQRDNIDDFIVFERERFSVSSPYVAFLDGEFISMTWTPDPGYNVLQRSWFVESKEFFKDDANRKKVYYSKPYISASTERFAVTMTAPIYYEDKLVGFAALDVNIGELEQRITDIDNIMGNWFVMSQNGDFLVYGSNTSLVGENIEDIQDKNAFMDMVKCREYGVIEVAEHADGIFVYVCDPVTRWIVAYTVNNDIVSSQVALVTYLLLFSAVLLVIVFTIIISVVSSKFTKPIVLLAREAEKIAAGNYDCSVDTTLRDELGYLTYRFNFMAKGLKEREEYEIHKARIDSELKAAQSIQSSILPKRLLESELFSSYAFYSSAREVGGDFYDYFQVNANCVVFCIGDVSGKGVPAALFMTMVCTLVRAICPVEPDPARALARLNNAISEHNSECMFATVFLVYYDPETGRVKFANAGHNPAYILENSSLKTSEQVAGMLVGGFSGVEYTAGEFDLSRGGTIVMYTDGITEAHSGSGELYSEKRLEEVLLENSDGSAAEIAESVVSSVDSFQNHEQFDDITLLILKRL